MGDSRDTAPRRLRFRYAKLGKIRFTSQRDVARMWERALRRSGLPVAWSEGFSPRPLLSFGLALPTGAESLGEYLDVRLEGAPRPGGGLSDAADLAERMSGLLPEGITVQAACPLHDGAVSLQQDVTSCDWELEVLGVSEAELTARVEQLLDSPSVVIRRERKGRLVDDDLRPALRTLTVTSVGVDRPLDPEGACRLRAGTATQPRGVRPRELLEGLGTDLELVRARRTHQWIERDGSRWEPLTVSGQLPAVVAARAERRAS